MNIKIIIMVIYLNFNICMRLIKWNNNAITIVTQYDILCTYCIKNIIGRFYTVNHVDYNITEHCFKDSTICLYILLVNTMCDHSDTSKVWSFLKGNTCFHEEN